MGRRPEHRRRRAAAARWMVPALGGVLGLVAAPVILTSPGVRNAAAVAGTAVILGLAGHLIVSARDRRRRGRHDLESGDAQRLDGMRQLAGGVAHHVNNTLTAIMGYAELLSRRLPRDDERRRDAEQIRRVAEESAGVIRQLLTFSGRGQTVPSACSLNAAAEAVHALLAPLVGDDIVMSCRLDPGLATVRGDQTSVERVVSALVLNARDAMPAGGTLTVETRNIDVDTASTDTPPGASTGTYASLAVSDTGTGIDPAVADRVFEPFFTTKEPGDGMGLGLAMVHGAVRHAGGFITVDSEPSRGTTVRVHFPAA